MDKLKELWQRLTEDWKTIPMYILFIVILTFLILKFVFKINVFSRIKSKFFGSKRTSRRVRPARRRFSFRRYKR